MERGNLDLILKAFNLPAYDASENDYDQLYDHCLKIATQIESGMFAKFDCQINKDYSGKYRQLQTSLKNDDNYDLRLKILTGEIDAMKVTDLQQNQLTSKRVIEMQLQQQ